MAEDEQREHWERTYQEHPEMYGAEPSAPARYAADVFARAGVRDVVELGAGHGRDALWFARRGFSVLATDFSAEGLGRLAENAETEGLAARVGTAVVDVREPLPFRAGSADAVFAHMLLCMDLSTGRIEELVTEVRRTLRPGGTFVYTVRHTGDAHYGAGLAHGDDIYEHGGFAVHFFPRALVDRLAEDWELREVHAFEEGALPRRLWRVTMTVPAAR
ncbi:class I SAM-dependent methyltransferase [Streptomyces sp. NPDC126499]|uniref:class I SAM-dependent methyltransferase n=1 Tax=Streptomyces sp. NPDC126499 TaxID=3155314 RepID=UPI00332A2B77